MTFKQMFTMLFEEMCNGDVAAWFIAFIMMATLYIMARVCYVVATEKKQIPPRARACCCPVHGYCIHTLWDEDKNLWVCHFPGCFRLSKVVEQDDSNTDIQ